MLMKIILYLKIMIFFVDGMLRKVTTDSIIFEKRHGWAKDWFISNILNKGLLLKLQSGSYLSIVHPEMDVKVSRGIFFGVFNDTKSSFATSYPINYDSYNDEKKYHKFQISSSWDGLVNNLSKSVDLAIVDYNPNLEWYTGKEYSVSELPSEIIDASDTDVLDNENMVKTLYVPKIYAKIRIYDPDSGFEYLNYSKSYVRYRIRTYLYRESEPAFSLTWPNDADNADDAEHDVKIEISVMPENGIEIWSPNNTVTFDGKVINSKVPVAKINGEYKDGFILSEKFEYTQEKYDSLKSSGDTTASFKLNGDADLSPVKNPIESWFWHNQDETQNTSIEISKVDSGRYPVALIVKDSAGKYDSVSGFVEVKVFVDGEEKDTPLPESIDPNEMSGPAGVGEDRKILPGQWLEFKIHFENHSDATAAAQEIHITNMLSNYLDWSTFELGEIVFKNQIVTSLSGKNSGSAEVALSDGSQSVRMQFSLDPATGKAYWYMRSVDPNTADGWPLDPYAGFLPPNDANGNGEGYVAYRVKVRGDAPNGVVVDSTASIIFDYNEPIQTDPSWSNTVYAGAPGKPELTTIGEILNGSTTLSWSAADFASSYDVYIWESGTECPSEATISDIQSTSISFELDYINGNSYNFLVVAKNKYGETQSQISTAETKKVETYAKWSAENLVGFTADQRGKNASSYNDNISNLEKYVFGLSAQRPTSINENGNFNTYVGDDGVVRVRYPMRRYMSDASVKVSYSTDLKTWKTDGISTTTITEGEEISVYESGLDGLQPKNIWFKVEAAEKN